MVSPGQDTNDWLNVLVPAGAGILGYLLLLFANPVVDSFRDGWLVLRRYPAMWIWLVSLSLAYVVFQIIATWQTGEVSFSAYDLIYWPPWKTSDVGAALARAALPGLDLLSGLFNQCVASFPVSGIAAALFLINWRGMHLGLVGAMRARLGRWWPVVYLGILVCAVGAVLKPCYIIGIRILNIYFDGIFLLRVGAVIDAVSFQFEYLFGLIVQTHLILLTLVWIRGLNTTPDKVFDFALRRGPHLAKWAGLVLLVTTLSIHLPLLISYLWIGQFTDFTAAVVTYVDQSVRALLAITFLVFCSVEITLVLHNDSLKEALAAHTELIRMHWHRLIWFLIVAGVHLLFACWLGEWLAGAYPTFSTPRLLAWAAIAAVKAWLIAWCLAAWVCLYRKLRRERKEVKPA